LFTNAEIPIVDGINLVGLLRNLGVQVVQLPITFRLPKEGVSFWGNQFYILDIIKYAASNENWESLIVLDCDCVWRRPATRIFDSIRQHGCLTYTLDNRHYPWNAPINGVTRQEMASALTRWTAESGIHIPREIRNSRLIQYHGGEIFAASRSAYCDVATLIDSLWRWRLRKGSEFGGIAEEAHFLSILYAFRAYPNNTANPFLRRIWTTFRENDVAKSDFDLTIWHLPAEKKTGFRRLFQKLTTESAVWKQQSKEDYEMALARTFGIPRRSPGKFLSDLSVKLMEKRKHLLHRVEKSTSTLRERHISEDSGNARN
jgi:hypothetical protein